MRCLIVRVYGQVQGVGFRFACKHLADRLGISGWVRNRADGSVEACLHGYDEPIQEMQDWLQRGPSFARVEHVDIHEPLDGEVEYDDTAFVILHDG